MPIDPIPYLIVSQELDLPPDYTAAKTTRVYVCLNLLDHRAIGIAASRDGAMEAMQTLSGELPAGKGPAFDFGREPLN